MGTHHPIRKTVPAEPPVIPDKLYFRIGDVAKLCDVPAYVLRFWETEFKQLKPNKGGTGQRLYRRKDVEMALRIKSLLYEQGYTIPGARQVFAVDGRLKEEGSAAPEAVSAAAPIPAPVVVPAAAHNPQRAATLQTLRDDLRQLLHDLSQPIAPAQRLSSIQFSPAQLSVVQPSPIEPSLADPELTPAPEPANKVKAMRPRLTLEPKPEARPKPEPIRPKLQQGDLFAFVSEDDEPDPVAS